MPFWLCIILAVLILVLFSGGYMFVVGCVRKKELPWLDGNALANTNYGKYYSAIALADQWLKDQKAQEVSITSHDGLRLCGYWIPVENAKGTVLLAHGYRSTMLCDFCCAFEFYQAIGMNILVPYQRSHGKSQGRYITFGVKESRDMAQWIRFHNEKLGDWSILLYGISMGASTMLYLADRDLPDNVKGIIADCGFTSPKDILSSVFKSVTHLPAAPTVIAADLFARLFAGFSLFEKDSRKVLRNAKLPVLLIHGKDDDFVPCYMSQQAYDNCFSEKTLLLVDGADHGVSFLADSNTYSDYVLSFIKKYMPGFI